LNDKDARYSAKRALLYEKSCTEELEKMQAKLEFVEQKELADAEKRKKVAATAVASITEKQVIQVYVLLLAGSLSQRRVRLIRSWYCCVE